MPVVASRRGQSHAKVVVIIIVLAIILPSLPLFVGFDPFRRSISVRFGLPFLFVPFDLKQEKEKRLDIDVAEDREKLWKKQQVGDGLIVQDGVVAVVL
ncbi:unnamed protein product [Calypogeia fissa]